MIHFENTEKLSETQDLKESFFAEGEKENATNERTRGTCISRSKAAFYCGTGLTHKDSVSRNPALAIFKDYYGYNTLFLHN